MAREYADNYIRFLHRYEMALSAHFGAVIRELDQLRERCGAGSGLLGTVRRYLLLRKFRRIYHRELQAFGFQVLNLAQKGAMSGLDAALRCWKAELPQRVRAILEDLPAEGVLPGFAEAYNDYDVIRNDAARLKSESKALINIPARPLH